MSIEVTDEQCADIMCTALEGGVGHWCSADGVNRTGTKAERKAGADWDYVSFEAYDAEDGDHLGRVDYGTIRSGVERVLSGAVKVCTEVRDGVLAELSDYRGLAGCRIDADAADCVVQAGLFGEVAYG